MPDTMTQRPKATAVSSLQELRVLAQQYRERAQAIHDEADTAGRDLTDAEEAEFVACIQAVEEYEAELQAGVRQDRSAGRRQLLQDMSERVQNLPDPVRALSRGPLAQVHFMTERWQKDPQWGFKSHADFAQLVFQSAVHGVTDERLSRVLQYQAVMDHNSPQNGGFLLPPQHNTTIHNAMMGRRTNLMAMCTLYPLNAAGTLELVANAETSRVSGSRWGGVQSFWTEDGTVVTDSNPKARLLELRPRQLATLIKVNNTLLANAAALEAHLDAAGIDDQIQTINGAILRGDGAAKPKGFLVGATGGSYVAISKESGQAAATIVDDNVHKMWARILDEENAVWLVNRDAVPEIEGLTANGTTGQTPVMLANANGYPTLAMPGPMMLKGRPIRRLEQCSTLGTVGDIILANMAGYVMAYRARGDGGPDGAPGIQKEMSMHLEFDRNRTAFRYIIQVDGQAWQQTAITPENGTAVLSDFVTIETRS